MWMQVDSHIFDLQESAMILLKILALDLDIF